MRGDDEKNLQDELPAKTRGMKNKNRRTEEKERRKEVAQATKQAAN